MESRLKRSNNKTSDQKNIHVDSARKKQLKVILKIQR